MRLNIGKLVNKLKIENWSIAVLRKGSHRTQKPNFLRTPEYEDFLRASTFD